MTIHIETEEEDDGRWIANIPPMPGVMVYGVSKEDANQKVKALAESIKRENITK